jgi:WD40 repeat protein/mono/diheme cytochrome c family protein
LQICCQRNIEENGMISAKRVRLCGSLLAALLLSTGPAVAAEDDSLARKAQQVLEAHCHRCHGQDGAIEGGMNYILDLGKLVARKKVLPGSPDTSPLYKRVAGGKMPPPGEEPRPTDADQAVLRAWIEAGAPSPAAKSERPFVAEADVLALILRDLDRLDKRSRRFTRYFSLAVLANAGLGEDELQTYRNALAKLLNSLSWHPRITLPTAVDPQKLVLRIDLRDFQWDANLWNRLLAEYPFGVFHDSATARACSVATATRMPVVRADWFVATASRPPLYQDLLQLPTNSAELERQLRVDVLVDLQQERVARAGFNGSGISRNNRLIERHDAVHGAYWRTYDFDAVPQNLVERQNLLPDRRNLFAYPLGPGIGENLFQHAGGEIIFNLPNGLQGFMLVNAVNQRIDKGPVNIVSDPKRPDRAVETGVSCIACHYRGINPKSDQIRDYVDKNPKAFSRGDAELIRALYAPEAKMKALMDEDAERFRRAVEKTGNKITIAEPVMAVTLRYEADVDLATAAAEAGLSAAEFQARLARSEPLARNLGALKVPGGTVSRQVLVQTFGDVVKELRLGLLFEAGLAAQTLPDNTGEIDPLEAQSSQANSMAFAADGARALIASPDKTVRLWDVGAERELRRFVGHTASVWSVAFSPDGSRALSGSMDTTVRLWDVATGRELRRLQGHEGLVTALAFSPDGRKALSGGYDHAVILWDLDAGTELRRFADATRYVNTVAFTPDGRRGLFAGENTIHLVDLESGTELRRLEGHTDMVVSVAVSPDGRRLLSGSDDRTVRLWDLEVGRVLRTFQGHTSFVKCVAFSEDGKQALSGGSDQTLRLWDVETGQEGKRFTRHTDAVIQAAFAAGGGKTISGSRDGAVKLWQLARPASPKAIEPDSIVEPRGVSEGRELRPIATIPVNGTVGSLLLSPDRQALYYLNLTDGKAGRVDLTTLKRDRELRLAEGTEAMCLTPDGKTLVATAAGGSGGKVQVIDPGKMELRKTLQVSGVPYDVAATDGGLIFLSGGSGDWTDLTVLDLNREVTAARWGGLWTRSFLQLAPAQDRLYVSTQGVSPGYVEALPLASKLDDKPAALRSPSPEKHSLGGEFLLTPDGQFLLCKTGTVLRLAPGQEGDLQYAATVEPFLAAAVDPGHGAVLILNSEGAAKQYTYPEFKLQATHRLGTVAFQAALDGKSGRLYVAGFDPRTLGGKPRARGFGDIFVYEVKDLLRARAR